MFMSIFSRFSRRQLLHGALAATIIAGVIALSIVYGPVTGALALACVEVIILVAGVAASLKAAARVGDLYADTLARSSWPGRHEEQ